MANHIHRWLAVGAVFVALLGVAGWRALATGDSPRGAPSVTPAPQLTQLLAYAVPMPDTFAIAGPVNDTFLMPRDPFVGEHVAPIRAATAAAGVPRHPGVDGPRWIVTAIMITDTRRAAVINDVLIYVGDSVPGGGKLTAVERDRVVVTDPKGTSHTVTVKEGES
jgi:hypothetical protein